MAVTIKEIKHWLDTFNENHMVGTAEDGLTLVVYPPWARLSERENAYSDPQTGTGYFEIGGVPDDPDEHDDPDDDEEECHHGVPLCDECEECEEEEEDDDGEPQA